MSGWDAELAARFEAAMTRGVAAIVHPEDTVSAVALGLLGALVDLLPATVRGVARPIIDAMTSRAEAVSVTIPTSAGPVIVLSKASQAEPVTASCAILHEMTHAAQVARAGAAQSVTDYLGSGELRAQREADAHAAGMWLRYVLTGEMPADPPALSELYHLADDDQHLARDVMAAHVATIRAGCVPNVAACVEAAKWLRAQAPEAIADGVHMMGLPS